MSNLTPWEPAGETTLSLREAIDRLFDDAITHPFNLNGGPVVPSIDLYQTTEDVVVRAALPGLKPEDVQIAVAGDVLTLRGEFRRQDEKKDATWHIREQQRGTFERSVLLPGDVKSDEAEASFENGILTITLPRSEAVKPHTIPVKGS